MRWKEILIGGCIYMLVILSGYGIPFFIHLVKSHCRTLIAVEKKETKLWQCFTHGTGL